MQSLKQSLKCLSLKLVCHKNDLLFKASFLDSKPVILIQFRRFLKQLKKSEVT